MISLREYKFFVNAIFKYDKRVNEQIVNIWETDDSHGNRPATGLYSFRIRSGLRTSYFLTVLTTAVKYSYRLPLFLLPYFPRRRPSRAIRARSAFPVHPCTETAGRGQDSKKMLISSGKSQIRKAVNPTAVSFLRTMSWASCLHEHSSNGKRAGIAYSFVALLD